MSCFNVEKTLEEKRARFLLGSTKDFSQTELKLFNLCMLCDCSKKGTITVESKEGTLENAASQCGQMSGGSCQLRTQACSDKYDSRTFHTSESAASGHNLSLFIPKSNIPGILLQQTYRQWKSGQDLLFNISAMRKRKNIYIQPLEVFPDFINSFEFRSKSEIQNGFFKLLQKFVSLFFMGFNVELKNTKLIEEYGWKVTTRYHKKTGEKQLLVSDIYKNMKRAIPSDGFAMLAVTWTDLYPSEELNFVLGEASSENRSGVFCFGRFEPKSYVGDVPPPPITEITPTLIWRMLKLISHECCHIFGLAHCVYFHCSMNESSSMAEALSQPIFLCPVCLRKLKKCCGFDILLRYEALKEFFVEIHDQYPSDYFDKAIDWLTKCLDFLKGDDAVENVSKCTHL